MRYTIILMIILIAMAGCSVKDSGNREYDPPKPVIPEEKTFAESFKALSVNRVAFAVLGSSMVLGGIAGIINAAVDVGANHILGLVRDVYPVSAAMLPTGITAIPAAIMVVIGLIILKIATGQNISMTRTMLLVTAANLFVSSV